MRLEPIINSLLDTDLYKFNMDQVIFHKHTDLSGEYYFRCRNEGIVFTQEMFEEINAQIDHLCTLTFSKDELDYLRSIRFIKNDYVEFLRLWRPIRDYVETRLTDEGRLKIVVRGPLFSAMQFEIYLLEIVNEVYFRLKYDYMTLRRDAEKRLDEKIAAFLCKGDNILTAVKMKRYFKHTSPLPDDRLSSVLRKYKEKLTCKVRKPEQFAGQLSIFGF